MQPIQPLDEPIANLPEARREALRPAYARMRDLHLADPQKGMTGYRDDAGRRTNDKAGELLKLREELDVLQKAAYRVREWLKGQEPSANLLQLYLAHRGELAKREGFERDKWESRLPSWQKFTFGRDVEPHYEVGFRPLYTGGTPTDWKVVFGRSPQVEFPADQTLSELLAAIETRGIELEALTAEAEEERDKWLDRFKLAEAVIRSFEETYAFPMEDEIFGSAGNTVPEIGPSDTWPFEKWRGSDNDDLGNIWKREFRPAAKRSLEKAVKVRDKYAKRLKDSCNRLIAPYEKDLAPIRKALHSLEALIRYYGEPASLVTVWDAINSIDQTSLSKDEASFVRDYTRNDGYSVGFGPGPKPGEKRIILTPRCSFAIPTDWTLRDVKAFLEREKQLLEKKRDDPNTVRIVRRDERIVDLLNAGVGYVREVSSIPPAWQEIVGIRGRETPKASPVPRIPWKGSDENLGALIAGLLSSKCIRTDAESIRRHFVEDIPETEFQPLDWLGSKKELAELFAGLYSSNYTPWRSIEPHFCINGKPVSGLSKSASQPDRKKGYPKIEAIVNSIKNNP